MRSLKGGKLIVSKGRERGKCYATNEKFFRFGSYLHCDYVLEHPQAKGVHCEITCDAFGRVTVTSFCKTTPVYINGKPLRSTTRILSGATIRIFDETFVWDCKSNKRKSMCAEHSLQPKTPDTRIRRRSEAPNSAPNLRTAKVKFHHRRTVHNLLNPGRINDDDGDRKNKSMTNPEKIESEPATPKASGDKIETPNPRISSIKIDESSRRITRSPTTKLSLCKTSDFVVTSYSPVSNEAYISRSFNNVSKNESKSTIYGTPEAVIISDCSDVELVKSDCGPTSKSFNQSSVFLIDLLTPRKEITHKTGSPLLKSVLKSSAKKAYNSMKLQRKAIVDVSDATPFSHGKQISFKNDTATSQKHQKTVTRSAMLHRRSKTAPAAGLRKSTIEVDTPRSATSAISRSLKATKRLNYSQKAQGDFVEQSKIESRNISNRSINGSMRKSLITFTPRKSEIRGESVDLSPNHFANMATSTPMIKLNELDAQKNKSGSKVLRSQNKSSKEAKVGDVLLSRILKYKTPAKRDSPVDQDEPNLSKTKDKENKSKSESNSAKNKLLNALREIKTANLIKQQSLREQFAIMSVNDTEKTEKTPLKNIKANSNSDDEENKEQSATGRKVDFQLSFDITEDEKENIAVLAMSKPLIKESGSKKFTEKTPLREKGLDLSGIKELLATPDSHTSEISKSRFDILNPEEFVGTPIRTSICFRASTIQKTPNDLNFSHGDKIFTSSASKRIMIHGKLDEDNEEQLQLSSKCTETIADDEEPPSDIAGISVAKLFESNKKAKQEEQDDVALEKEEMLTLDDSFNKLVGKPIIKRDYSRQKRNSRVLGIPVSSPENSCAELEKLDIQKWLDNVKVPTDPTKESLEIDSPCSKSKRLSQLSISRISTVSILDDSVTRTQGDMSAIIVSSQSTNGVHTPTKGSIEREANLSKLSESPKNQTSDDLKELNDFQEASLSSVKVQLSKSNNFIGSTDFFPRSCGKSKNLSLTKTERRSTRSRNSVPNEKEGSFKDSPKSLKSTSYTINDAKNQHEKEEAPEQKSLILERKEQEETTKQRRRTGKIISLNETFDLGDVSEDEVAGDDMQKDDNEISNGNVSEPSANDERKSDVYAKANRSSLIPRRTASPSFKAKINISQGPIETEKQTVITRKSLATKAVQSNEVLPRRLTRNARKTMDELENISFHWNISKEQKEFEEAFENFKQTSETFNLENKSQAADEDVDRVQNSRYSATQSLNKSLEDEKSEIEHETEKSLELAEDPPLALESSRRSAIETLASKLVASAWKTMNNSEKELEDIEEGSENLEDTPEAEDKRDIGNAVQVEIKNVPVDGETDTIDHDGKSLFENFSEQPSKTLRSGRKSEFHLLNNSVKSIQKLTKARRTLLQTPLNGSFNVEDAKRQYEKELLFKNFSEEPQISSRKDRKSVVEFTRKKSLRITRKSMGVKPDNESFDWNAAKKQKELEEAFENFEEIPEPKVIRGKSQGPSEIGNNSKKSRRTVGQPPLNESFDIEAARKEHEKEILFENFNEQPLRKLRSNRKSESNTIAVKSTRTTRMTMGHKPQNDSFDWKTAKEQKEMAEAFANFEEIPVPKAFRGKSIGSNEVVNNLKKNRRTVGQPPLTESFDIEAAKQEHEKKVLFEKFTEEPLKNLRSNRKSESGTIVVRSTRSTRMTMGHIPQNVSFNWQSAKEQKELEEAFENFEEIPALKTTRGKSQSPDELQVKQTRNRRTVGQPPISESLDIEAAKAEHEKEMLFENFSDKPLRHLRGNRKSETSQVENKSKRTDRMTMGNKPQNVSFDWQTAKKQKELEEAFENFKEIPETKSIRGKSQGPDEILQTEIRSRRTVGQLPLSESFDVEAAKEEYEKEKLFENFSEKPLKNLRSNRKSEINITGSRSTRSVRKTMGNQPQNVSFDWQTAKEQKELEEAFENFEEAAVPKPIRGKSQGPDEMLQTETRNRRTVGQPPLNESFDIEAAKAEYEKEKLFENFSEKPSSNLANSRKSEFSAMEDKTRQVTRRSLGCEPKNVSFDWQSAKEQIELEKAFENFEETPDPKDIRGKSVGPDDIMLKVTNGRRTLGQPPLSESFDIEAAKEQHEKAVLFENFTEKPLKILLTNRKSELKTTENKAKRTNRMTMGHNPKNISFDWRAAKEQKEMEEAFEYFEQMPEPKTIRGKSQGPDEILPRETRNRRTVGQPPLSESFDVEAAKEEHEKEVLFENFTEKPLKSLRNNRRSELDVTEKSFRGAARMTMGNKPQNISFDWQSAKRQKDLEEAFENFTEAPQSKNIRGKSQGPDEILTIETRNRRTVGQNPLSESFDIETAKEEFQKGKLFENFSEQPATTSKSGRKSEINPMTKRVLELSRRTLGNKALNVSFDWNSAKEQKEGSVPQTEDYGSVHNVSTSNSIHLEVTDNKEEEVQILKNAEPATQAISISPKCKNESESNIFDSIIKESICNNSLNVSDIHPSHTDEKLRKKFSLSKQTSTPMSLHKKLSFKETPNNNVTESKVDLSHEEAPSSVNKRSARKKHTPNVPLPMRRTRRQLSVLAAENVTETEIEEVQETPQKEVPQTRTRRNMRNKQNKAEESVSIAEQVVSASKTTNSTEMGQTIVNHVLQINESQLNTDVGQQTIENSVKEKSRVDETVNITSNKTHVDASPEKSPSSVITNTLTEDFPIKEEADDNDTHSTTDRDTKTTTGRKTRKRVVVEQMAPVRRTRRKVTNETAEQTLESQTSTKPDQKMTIIEETADTSMQPPQEDTKQTTNRRKPRRNARKNEASQEGKSQKSEGTDSTQDLQIPEISSTELQEKENAIKVEVSAEKADSPEKPQRSLRGRRRKAVVESESTESSQTKEVSDAETSTTKLENEDEVEKVERKRRVPRKAVEMRVAVTKRNLRRKMETNENVDSNDQTMEENEVHGINNDENIPKKRVRFARNRTLNSTIDTETETANSLCSNDTLPAKIKSEEAVTVQNLPQNDRSIDLETSETDSKKGLKTENIVDAHIASEMKIPRGRKKLTKKNNEIKASTDQQNENNDSTNKVVVGDENEISIGEKEETWTRRGRRAVIKEHESGEEISKPKRRGRPPNSKKANLDEKENLVSNENESLSQNTINPPSKKVESKKGHKNNSKTEISVEVEEEIIEKSEENKDVNEKHEEPDSGTKTRTLRKNNAKSATETASTKSKKAKVEVEDVADDNSVEVTEKDQEQKVETKRGGGRRRKNDVVSEEPQVAIQPKRVTRATRRN